MKPHGAPLPADLLHVVDEDTSRKQLQNLLHRAMSFSAASQEAVDSRERAVLVARLERMHHQAAVVDNHKVADAVQDLLDDLARALDKLAAAQDRLACAEAAAAAVLTTRPPRSDR